MHLPLVVKRKSNGNMKGGKQKKGSGSLPALTGSVL
jgi:hypothetical protein